MYGAGGLKPATKPKGRKAIHNEALLTWTKLVMLHHTLCRGESITLSDTHDVRYLTVCTPYLEAILPGICNYNKRAEQAINKKASHYIDPSLPLVHSTSKKTDETEKEKTNTSPHRRQSHPHISFLQTRPLQHKARKSTGKAPKKTRRKNKKKNDRIYIKKDRIKIKKGKK